MLALEAKSSSCPDTIRDARPMFSLVCSPSYCASFPFCSLLSMYAIIQPCCLWCTLSSSWLSCITIIIHHPLYTTWISRSRLCFFFCRTRTYIWSSYPYIHMQHYTCNYYLWWFNIHIWAQTSIWNASMPARCSIPIFEGVTVVALRSSSGS